MTTKHSNLSSRHYPLKRVRLDNENHGFIPTSHERNRKKFRRQSSEDSAFVEIEKSPEERGYDLFHKEYFSQFRPYFKQYSIVVQFIEHLWLNMIESSKVSFVKKKLKEQGICDESTKNFNDTNTFSNDENDFQINRSLNDSNRVVVPWKSNNKYSRGYINDLLSYVKQWIPPRFIDRNTLSNITPLRRSSRIRRAPVKCDCATCVMTHTNEQCSSSISVINNDSQQKSFHQLIEHYRQLDDQYADMSNSSLFINDDNKMKVNEINDSQLSKITDTPNHVTSSSPIISPVISKDIHDLSLPSLSNSSMNVSIDSGTLSSEKTSLPSTSELPVHRTYVILTELDEPFFGPYPIEFTITI